MQISDLFRKPASTCVMLICFASLAQTAPAQSATPTEPVSDSTCISPQTGNITLGRASCNVADEIQALQLIRRLGAIDKHKLCSATPEAIPGLLLRQDIMERIQSASLEVDSFLAEIDSERSNIQIVSDKLSDKKDRAVKYLNISSVVAGVGNGVVPSALALTVNNDKTQNWISVIAGSMSSLFSYLGLVQNGPRACFPNVQYLETGKGNIKSYQDEWKAKGKQCVPRKKNQHPETPACATPVPGCSPSMLFGLFHRGQHPASNFFSDYPATISRYLDDAWVSQNGELGATTRRDDLRNRWAQIFNQEEGKFANDNDQPAAVTIDDLTNRTHMLSDLHFIVSLMKTDLKYLSNDLTNSLHCSDDDR